MATKKKPSAKQLAARAKFAAMARARAKAAKGKKTITKKTTTKKIGSLLPEHKPFFKKISKATAKKRFIENMEVYGLYDDGSESLIESLNDFDNRGFYAYGYEIKSETMGKTTTSRHTDTKSHNVRINVLSGIKDTIYNDLKKIESNIEKLNDALIRNKQTMKLYPYKTPFWKNYFLKHNAEIVKMISSLKKQKTELKKNI